MGENQHVVVEITINIMKIMILMNWHTCCYIAFENARMVIQLWSPQKTT